ncbi:MAG: hypothetical protein CVV33_00190 [Methanomicrobiales archaeon HGW-Methanomicrobiales-4]|nr:MAG: hypothetical protein CVV33_00190 [Methanomicrobiales archaeon HGW-Methanomicrobiales-4]
MVTLILLSTGIVTVVADDTLDNGPYVIRSNVMGSTVDPSFWDERESLSIEKVQKPLLLPTGKPNNIPIVCSYVRNSSDADLTAGDLAVIANAQEMALILVNNPYYQAGDSVFKLDDKLQVQLSSVKYAATREYYGRTDVSSSWVTDFYNAAYCEDFPNLTLLLEELPAEV